LAAKGWRLVGLGAYFAYLEHPFDISATELAKQLVEEAGVLALPGFMFLPVGDDCGRRHLRIAFANISAEMIVVLFDRMAQVSQ
jgi:aspartate/methionine/tyrosine aminotransferase